LTHHLAEKYLLPRAASPPLRHGVISCYCITFRICGLLHALLVNFVTFELGVLFSRHERTLFQFGALRFTSFVLRDTR
jgi:hypothetical protein